jgi:MtN3 and saliva related transmembrane protein
MNNYAQYIGIGAGICTAASLLPQLLKIVKEKKAEAISYGMLGTLLAGLAGWIWYGILKTDWPIIVTNCFSFVINILIIVFSAKYKKVKSKN